MLDRVAHYDEDFGYVEKDGARRGLFARVFGGALRRPGRVLASLVMIAASAAIVANAAFFQTEHHPAPFMSTRTDEGLSPTTAAASNPAAGDEGPSRDAANDLTRLVSVSAQTPPPIQSNPTSATITEIQQLLATLGYNPGTADGLMGTRTRSAIQAYQRDQGVAQTGNADTAVLTALRATAAARNNVTASIPTTDAAQVQAVQNALNRSGFGPVPVDGRLDSATADAIRGFQLEYGLNPTGRIDDALISRMIAVGALARN